MPKLSIRDIDLEGKRVFMRVDFNVPLAKGGQEIFTLPRVAALRTFVFNHLIHHRGQLTVYLRLRDVPLPSIYGPTADEGAF